MSRTFDKVVPDRLRSVPWIEALEDRRLLSGLLSSLNDVPVPLPATLLGSSSSGGPALISLPPASSTSASPSAEIASPAPGGLLTLGLQANVNLPSVLDLQTEGNLEVGGATQDPLLAVKVSVGSGTPSAAGPVGLSLNLGLAAASPSGTLAGSGGTSTGANGGGGGLSLLLNLDLGGQPASDPLRNIVPPEGNSSSAVPPSTIPISGVILSNSASGSGASVPMTPPSGLPPQAGLPALLPASQPAEQSEEVQLAIAAQRLPMREQLLQAEGASEEIDAAPALRQLPGRLAATTTATPPGAPGESQDEFALAPSVPAPDASENTDSTEPIPWLLPFPGLLGLDGEQLSEFGPLDSLSSPLGEELGSIPQRLDELMEWAEAEGLSPASWVLLGLAGVLASEFATRRFRRDPRADTTEESAGEPAVV